MGELERCSCRHGEIVLNLDVSENQLCSCCMGKSDEDGRSPPSW